MFEFVYFANPESIMDQENVYAARLKTVLALERKSKNDSRSDSLNQTSWCLCLKQVESVPLGMCEEAGLPYRELLIKNRYIQRSFILNSQKIGKGSAIKAKPS